ncbi:S26 family signal peptidase [Weissella confusa]|uniref:S26 family signal peptidase n=1 Tax=Weissella confusa TaxID=1583 RepID=A0A923NDZ7_WEICO|nr:S26 family signal peptidase [Weissella confusa]
MGWQRQNPIAIGLIIALLIKSYWFTLVRVDGTSMEPNLTNNERVFVLKPDKVHRGSVVVFDAYGEDPEVDGHKIIKDTAIIAVSFLLPVNEP